MQYCSVQDLRNALAPDTAAGTSTHSAADLSDSILVDNIEQASADVDTYVGGPYDPAEGDEIPAVIRFWTRDIAVYYATISWRKSQALPPNDPVVLRYNTAMNRLEKIASGELDIPSPEAPEDQPVVVNPYDGLLILAGEFDLTGRSSSQPGFFRIWRDGGALFWTGDQ